MRIEEALDRATASSVGGRREEARDLLLDVLASDPANLEAWLRLAELAASPERAALYYQRAAAIDPKSLRAQRGLEEARHALQPVKPHQEAEPQATPAHSEGPLKEAPPSAVNATAAGALPPDSPVFIDNEVAPFRLDVRKSPRP